MILALLATCTPAIAADEAPLARKLGLQPKLEFPSDTVGGEAPRLESLRGKGVLLYFFEEGCPKCSERWPEILETARQYEDEPIFFFAVNSGTPKPVVEMYARQFNVGWPILVDTDRTFEQACRVPEVSTKNIIQVRYITADGKMEDGFWSDIDGAIKRALKGAKWNVDPKEIPSELRETWMAVELGRYTQVATRLKRDRSARSPAVREATHKLSDYIDQRLHEELDAAGTKAKKDKYLAYQHYTTIAGQFAGYPAASEAAKAGRELAKDAEVKSNLASLKLFEKQRQLFDSPKSSIHNKAVANLEKLIEDQPSSAGAKAAQDLLLKK